MTAQLEIFTAASKEIFCFSDLKRTYLSEISVRRRVPALSCVKLENVKWRHCIVLGNKKIVELKQWNHETRSSIWSSAPSPSHPSSLHGCKKEISVEGKQMGKDIRLSPYWIVSRDTWQIVRTFQLVVVNILSVNLARATYLGGVRHMGNHHSLIWFYQEREWRVGWKGDSINDPAKWSSMFLFN